MFDHDHLDLLTAALGRLEEGFASLPSVEATPTEPSVSPEALSGALHAVAERLQDNFPYPHPLYAGQMLKPPHPVARLAYALTQWLNPNNHALDGGRATSAMEKEAVAALASLFGWKVHLGHLCGGGTLANLEALWVARELHPGRVVLASDQAHYTHRRVCGVLGVPFRTVASDDRGRLDLEALEKELARGDVGTVVVSLGTTGLGAVDPLEDVLRRARAREVRVHLDAAYGGFFTLAAGLGEDARRAFDAAREADSIVIDPHKHGLQPYGCGCVLFRDPAVGRVYRHESPYTYFSSEALHLGEISLECSRPGAAAAALWATQRVLPYVPGGAFAASLDSCLDTARRLHQALEVRPGFIPLMAPELDIVVWAVAAGTASEASRLAARVFREAAAEDLHLALTTVPRSPATDALRDMGWDRDEVTCLRSCLMKPEHGRWLEAILTRLDRAFAVVQEAGERA